MHQKRVVKMVEEFEQEETFEEDDESLDELELMDDDE